jgi:DNA-binding NarL/FixJ family response regulator
MESFVARRPMDCAMKRSRVLLADSHLGMLGGVYGLLSALFESVVMVADERSLMAALATFEPDLVVLDLSLSGEGEANITSRLLAEHPGLRLVVLSVHDEPTVVCQVMGAGVAGFVLKRATATDLIPAVHATLADNKYISPGVQQLRDTAQPSEGAH